MRLDHLLSKEHTPRTIYRALTFVGVAVWWALVVFTSGIIDEHFLVMTCVPEYGTCSPLWGELVCGNRCAGCCWVSLAHCWALKDQAEGDVMSSVGLVFSWCLTS